MRTDRASFILLAAALLALSACVAVPVPAAAPATSVALAPAPTAVVPDLDGGRVAWASAKCAACHGPLALGGIGPALASTKLSYEGFVRRVRTAMPPMPAYDAAALSDRSAFDMYAWLRVQSPPARGATGPNDAPTADSAQPEDMMAMTIWTCKKCSSCHGVFAQGSASAPALAGLNDPLAKELARMRSTAATITEHSPESIADDLFERLYPWLKKGCLANECSQ